MALALGMTVGELLARMSATELAEWQAYYQIEPFGEENMNFGMIVATLANVNRKKGTRAVDPAECKIRVKKPQTAEQQMAIFKLLAEMSKHGNTG